MKGGNSPKNGRLKGLADYGIGRGSVIFDIENDGDMDILVINQKAVKDYPENISSVTHLYRNDSASGNWLKVALKGIQAESHGLGSRVEIVVNGKRMLREIDGGGSSHLSQNSTIAHFGLGEAQKVDSVIVKWTGGEKQILTDQAVNTLLTVTEPERAQQESPFTWLLIALLLIASAGGYLYLKRNNRI